MYIHKNKIYFYYIIYYINSELINIICNIIELYFILFKYIYLNKIDYILLIQNECMYYIIFNLYKIL